MRCPCRPHRTGLKSNRRSDLSLSAEAAGTRRASVTIATRAYSREAPEPPPQSLRDSSPSGGAVGSDCSRAACGGRCFDAEQPPSACGISPRGAGGGGEMEITAGLLGGSGWIGLLARCVRRSLFDRQQPPSACGISPRGAGGEGKWRLRAGLPRGSCRLLARPCGRSGGSSPPLPAAPRAGGVGSLPLESLRDSSPRGEQLDRTARALRAAVAASIVSSPPLPSASCFGGRGFLAAAGVGGVLHLGREQVGDAVLDRVAEVERA